MTNMKNQRQVDMSNYGKSIAGKVETYEKQQKAYTQQTYANKEQQTWITHTMGI